MRVKGGIAGAGCALILAGMTTPGRIARAQDHPAALRSIRVLHAVNLTGQTVEDPDGQELGTVRNLVFDMRNGSFAYVIVGSGGILGFGTTLRAVPPHALSAATAKRNVLAINMIKARWEQAPAFGSKLSKLADEYQAHKIRQYYTGTENTPKSGEPKTPTGRAPQYQAANKNGGLVYADKLLGATVLDSKREKLGDMLDLLVLFDRPDEVFAVFSGGKLFKDREQDFATALKNLEFNDGRIVVAVDRAALEQAPPLTGKSWSELPRTGLPRVFRYSMGLPLLVPVSPARVSAVKPAREK